MTWSAHRWNMYISKEVEKNQNQHTRCWSLRIDAIYSSTPRLYIPVLLPLAATPDWWHRTQPDGCSCQQLWVEIRFSWKNICIYLYIFSYPSIHPSIHPCMCGNLCHPAKLPLRPRNSPRLGHPGIGCDKGRWTDRYGSKPMGPLGDYHAFTLPAISMFSDALGPLSHNQINQTWAAMF